MVKWSVASCRSCWRWWTASSSAPTWSSSLPPTDPIPSTPHSDDSEDSTGQEKISNFLWKIHRAVLEVLLLAWIDNTRNFLQKCSLKQSYWNLWISDLKRICMAFQNDLKSKTSFVELSYWLDFQTLKAKNSHFKGNRHRHSRCGRSSGDSENPHEEHEAGRRRRPRKSRQWMPRICGCWSGLSLLGSRSSTDQVCKQRILNLDRSSMFPENTYSFMKMRR